MALLAALLLVPAAAHAAGPVQILRDCQDDDVLQGDYTLAELRKAQQALPTDIDEYSPCRDILERADQQVRADEQPLQQPLWSQKQPNGAKRLPVLRGQAAGRQPAEPAQGDHPGCGTWFHV